jgi:hypothetical protein
LVACEIGCSPCLGQLAGVVPLSRGWRGNHRQQRFRAALRAQAEGRKLWLFVGSDNRAKAAVLFSMTASCKRRGIGPYRYLADVLRLLPTAPPDRLAELLPDIWFQTHPSAARKRSA